MGFIFGGWDYFIKNGAHAPCYGLRALPNRNYTLAWILACSRRNGRIPPVLCAGRNASLMDVLVFDNLGAVMGLFIHARWSSSRE
jgi:hypothetical protein